MSDLAGITGQKASVVRVADESFKSLFPAGVGEAFLGNYRLLEDPGYYGGEDLSESLALLDEKPRGWREFVEATKEKWVS